MHETTPSDVRPARHREGDTKEALLDAAEWLFARQGIPSTSLRAVTQRAGTNIASVNYHFGSKEELIRAVLDRRLAPLNAERLRRLEVLEKAAGEEGPRLEAILDALITPAFQLTHPSRKDFTTLLARSHFEADPAIQDLIFSSFEAVVQRFLAALSRCLPQLSPAALLWRLNFAVGAMAMTIANSEMLARHAPVDVSLGAESERRERLVRFLAAGFRCPELTATEASS